MEITLVIMTDNVNTYYFHDTFEAIKYLRENMSNSADAKTAIESWDNKYFCMPFKAGNIRIGYGYCEVCF